MPRIPIYDQQQLASQQVGTPGVDSSGATLANAVSTAANKVAGAAEQSYLAQKLAEKRALAAQAAIEKQQKEVLDAAELAKHQYEIDNHLDQIRTKTQESNIQDPSGALGQFQDAGKQALDNYVGTIADPMMRAKVMKVGYSSLQSSNGRVNDWVREQRTKNVVAQGELMLDQFSIDLGNATTPEDFFQKAQQFEDKYAPEQRKALGPAYDVKLRNAKEQGAVNYLSGLVDSNDPAQVELAENILRSGLFDETIGRGKVKAVYNEIHSDIRRAKSDLAMQDKLDKHANALNFYQEAYANSPNGKIEGLSTKQLMDLQSKYPNLPDNVNVDIARAKSKSAQKGLELQSDQTLVKLYGSQIPLVNKLAAQADSLYNKAVTSSGNDRKKAIAELDLVVDRYHDLFVNMEQIRATVKDKDAKALLQAQGLQIQEITKKISGQLSKNKDVIGQNAKQAEFIQNVGTPGKLYSDPKQASVYNFYYRDFINRRFIQLSQKGSIDKAMRDRNYMQQIRLEAGKYAAGQANGYLGVRNAR